MSFTAEELGFASDGAGWRKVVGGTICHFRLLRDYREMGAVVELQRVVWDMSERDLVPPHELVTIPETGGMVLGVWRDGDPDLAGFVFGWGGYVDGRPRVASDMMGVRPALRSLGLGFALKSLQAAVALAGGFQSMIWTVDPLRAGNARLNLGKLGGYSHLYHRDLYGDTFGTGLYGAMPTDNLTIAWPIASRRVRDRLLGHDRPLTLADCAGLQRLRPGNAPRGDRLLVELPPDIDHLLIHQPEAAPEWRYRVRETLETAFAHGYAAIDAVYESAGDERRAFYVLAREEWQDWEREGNARGAIIA